MSDGRRASRQLRDDGDTLIEILVTVLVLGITVTAMIGALTLGIAGADSHRRLTDVEVLSRAYGEKVVDQAMHPATTLLAAAASAGDTCIYVTSTSGFPASGSFTAAVGGEVATITVANTCAAGPSGSTRWKVSTLADDHPVNASVTKYTSCPTAGDLYVAGFAVPTTTRVIAPDSRPATSTITKVEFFDNSGAPIAAAACGNYWTTTALPCSKFDSADTTHLTACDPALVRVTVEFDSTDASAATGAVAVTRVLIRRSNA